MTFRRNSRPRESHNPPGPQASPHSFGRAFHSLPNSRHEILPEIGYYALPQKVVNVLRYSAVGQFAVAARDER
jgi:hypothetical protein